MFPKTIFSGLCTPAFAQWLSRGLLVRALTAWQLRGRKYDGFGSFEELKRLRNAAGIAPKGKR